MVTLTHEEVRALRYVLGTVAAEADRLGESDPEAWATHAEVLDSVIADHYCKEGCICALDAKEADAVRFLITGMEWVILDGEVKVRDDEPTRKAAKNKRNLF